MEIFANLDVAFIAIRDANIGHFVKPFLQLIPLFAACVKFLVLAEHQAHIGRRACCDLITAQILRDFVDFGATKKLLLGRH